MLNLSVDTFSKMKNLRLLKPLFKLTMINLKGSQNLVKTPDFTTAPKLEALIMEGCTRLVDVHPSIGVLKSLKLLNLRDCKSLRSLPTKIGLESLETLILSSCSNLVRFPEIVGKMEHLKTLDFSSCYKIEYLQVNLQQVEFLEELDLSETSITVPPSFILQLKNIKCLSFNGCKGPSNKLLPNLTSLFKVTQGRRTNPMARMLPLLSGLSSLGKLKLRDCNLCEGDIPRDISGLSSLSLLDLSGNNFTSIPASLSRLSKLYSIRLSNCKMLKSLPELLTSIGTVWIDGCSLLEVVASPSKVCNLVDSGFIQAVNCFKLAENINALTLLKQHLKAFANSRKEFDIIMPGSEIPEWFSQQKSDSSIQIPRPIDLRKDNQWIGVVCCCIFVNNDASWDDESIMCGAFIRNAPQKNMNGWTLGKMITEPTMKDHLFLRYWSRDHFDGHFHFYGHNLFPLEDKFYYCETNDLRRTDFLDERCNVLEVSFNNKFGHSVKVKKCGVRIVYEKDLEEIRELQCHTTQSSPNFEHIHHHFAHNDRSVGSTSDIK
ncbi:TMV resistance N [Gossypium arboreum]|uniref:TMV resistance N n=1 Tax=Gossypium arboreum TaxID=29729 RepID=A0A0B0N3L5_GOSAR|nr:TMV resistance N [Gossypium arboreum]